MRRLAHVGDGAAPFPTSLAAQVRTSVSDLRAVGGELRRLRLTARILVAFLLFNDAIQAVIALASVSALLVSLVGGWAWWSTPTWPCGRPVRRGPSVP